MAWVGSDHLQAGPMAISNDPAIIGIDRELAAALLCFASVPGLLWPRLRKSVSVGIMLGIVYAVSAQRLAGTLDTDAWAMAPLFVAALYLWWPRLVMTGKSDG